MRREIWLAAVCGCLCLACSTAVTDFERMRQQRRTEPYAQSPVFADRSAMRSPPAGTVTYGPPVQGRVAPAADFHTFCAVCHGDDGSGQTPMGGNMPDGPVASLLTPESAARPDAEFFDAVSKGMGRMPRYDWALPASERWAVVAHVRALQRGVPAAGAQP